MSLVKPFSCYYGWDHLWYDPKCLESLRVREFIKGPFPIPKLVCSIPFVTRCQRDGTPLELREGIPDCWAEYLTRTLRFFRENLRNNELMRKEDADVVSFLRKYRLYIGQGIPDPWTAYLCNPEIFPHLNGTEHRKRLKNKKEERCLCCEREYLFECPDKCGSNANRCSCKDCHGKNSSVSDSTEKCRCSEIFHNWMLENRRRRRGRGSSGDGLSSPNGSHSETDDDGGNVKDRNKFVAFCSGSHKRWECSGSENSGLGGGDQGSNEKTLKCRHVNDKFLKHQSKVYFCPYIKNFYRRKFLESDKNFGEPKVSKEIQTDNPTIKSSKTVQTEKPARKAHAKCTCRRRCLPCGVLCRVKPGCSAVHSIPNFWCSPSFSQGTAFVCPYSFSNHFTTQKPCNSETGETKRRSKRKKKVKEKESDEGSNAELDQPDVRREEGREDRDKPAAKSKPKEDLHETTDCHDSLKFNKYTYNSETPSTTLDHLKFLASYKLKGYLQRDDISPGLSGNKFLHQNSSTGSKFLNGIIGNPSLSNLREEENSREKFKPFSRCRYSESSFLDSRMNVKHNNFSNIRRFSYCDQATMTASKETESDIVNKERARKEMISSDEPKACSFVKNHEMTRALGKRRKLLRNRKRRRKLVASILGHQESVPKPRKQTSNAKEVQVEGTPQGSVHPKRFLNQNVTSPSDHLNIGDNSDLRFPGAILNSRYKQEIYRK